MKTPGRISKARKKTDSQSKINTLFKAKSSASNGEAKKKTSEIQIVKEPLLTTSEELKTAVPEAVQEEQKDEDLPQENKDHILSEFKSFDLNQRFGPCMGLSRLERYQRAQKLHLDPPDHLLPFLESQWVQKDPVFRECLWFDFPGL